MFVFRSKRADRLKLPTWDGAGLVLAHKRLETGTFAWPKVADASEPVPRKRDAEPQARPRKAKGGPEGG